VNVTGSQFTGTLSSYCWNHKLENWANNVKTTLASSQFNALDLTHNQLVNTTVTVDATGGVSIEIAACPLRVRPASATPYTAWKCIETAVKLFRRGGNEYGHRIGSNHQKWCRLTGKRDTLKGMTRLRGVRLDALMKNAKPLLLTATNSIEAD
jgi:hypothetical protein